MAISIAHTGSWNSHQSFQVSFFNNSIAVDVTSMPEYVGAWIANVLSIHRYCNLIVGLDAEWRPNFRPNSPQNPVSFLQLCVGNMCLIFQIQYASRIPQELVDFLGDYRHAFVGVGVRDDARRLWSDYGLMVSNTVDLRQLAVDRLGNSMLLNAGLTAIGKAVLDVDYTKPRTITLSNWENRWLTYDQIQYASIDAFLSYDIGACLMNSANY